MFKAFTFNFSVLCPSDIWGVGLNEEVWQSQSQFTRDLFENSVFYISLATYLFFTTKLYLILGLKLYLYSKIFAFNFLKVFMTYVVARFGTLVEDDFVSDVINVFFTVDSEGVLSTHSDTSWKQKININAY